jgi:hypothetical protein
MSSRVLLDRIAQGFFGYGDLEAPLWFVGYEEHCENVEDARRRLAVLATLTGAVDVFEAHRLWSMTDPRSTSTWPEMQAIVAEAGLGDAHVGTTGSRTFLTELLPFPHAGVHEYYDSLYGAFALNRRTYEKRLLRPRCDAVRQQVERRRPRVVLIHRRRQGEELLSWLAGPGSMETIRLGGRNAVDVARRRGTTWLRSPNLSGANPWGIDERRALRRLVAAELAAIGSSSPPQASSGASSPALAPQRDTRPAPSSTAPSPHRVDGPRGPVTTRSGKDLALALYHRRTGIWDEIRAAMPPEHRHALPNDTLRITKAKMRELLNHLSPPVLLALARACSRIVDAEDDRERRERPNSEHARGLRYGTASEPRWS